MRRIREGSCDKITYKWTPELNERATWISREQHSGLASAKALRQGAYLAGSWNSKEANILRVGSEVRGTR